LPSTSVGPSPQLNGYADFNENWNENVTGRVGVLAFGQDNSGKTALFLGAPDGGIFRSVDFVKPSPTWTPLMDFVGLTPSSPVDPVSGLGAGAIDVGAIAVDPTNPKIIYVGTGDSEYIEHARYGTGILKSTNGGDTFSLVSTGGPKNPFFQEAISKIVVNRLQPNVLYASVYPWGGGKGDPANWGVWMNSNGGAGSWTKITDPALPMLWSWHGRGLPTATPGP